jgi:hypothetical protein
MSKIMFGIKIKFCKSSGADNIIDKKDRGLNWIFNRYSQFITYITRFFHFSPFSFNSILLYKKKKIGYQIKF